MNDFSKANRDLIEELLSLKQRIKKLEQSQTNLEWTKKVLKQQHELVMALGQTTDLQESLSACLSSALIVTEMDCGGIYLVDKASEGFHLAKHVGLSEAFVLTAKTVEPESPQARLIYAGQPVYMKHGDLTTDVQKLHEGLRALAVIPICHQGKVIACLNIASHTMDETPHEIRPFIESLAMQMGSFLSRIIIMEALQNSEKRFRELAETLPEAVFETDLEGIATFANRNAFDCFGYTQQDFAGGLNYLDFIAACDIERAQADIQRIMNGENIGLKEYTLRRKDGSTFPSIISSSVIVRDGKPLGLRGFIIDITERKQADEELRRTNAFLDSIVENIPNMIFLKDAKELRFIRLNRAGEDLLGNPREDLLGKNDYNFFPKEQADFFTQKDRETLGGKEVVVIPEESIHTRYKGERILRTKKVPIPDAKGNPEFLLGISEDITELKQAEEAQTRLVEEWQATFDNVRDAIWLLDAGQHILRTNRTAEETFGHPAEAMLGKHCWEIVHGLQEPIPECPLLRMRRSLRREQMELQIGERFFVVTVDPILDADGKLTGAIHLVSDITEHKQTEEKLTRQSEAMAASIDGMAILDQDQKYIYLNNAHASIYGYESPDELLGKTWKVLYNDSELKRFENKIMPRFFEKGRWRGEAVGRKKDGSEFFQDISLTALKNGGLICVVSDITARKQAEEELRTSRAKLSNALVMAHLGHWEYDVANDLFTFNDQFYKIFRTTVDQVGGYTMHSAEYARRFVHPDDIDTVGGEIRKAIETTDPDFNRQIEHRIIYADGAIGHITVRFFIIKDTYGKTIKTYGVNQDITARKQAEKALRDSEELFRNVFDNHAAVKLLIDPHTGNIIGANKVAAEYYGWPKEELCRMNIRDINTLSQDAVKHEVEKARTLQRTYFEFRHRRADGTVRDVAVFSSNIKTKGKAILHSIVHDITDRKQAEEEKRILQEHLQHADKMKAIGTLAGGIAHDFNNLLMGIQGYASLILLDLDTSNPHYEKLKRIEEQVQRGAELAGQLLGFARGGRYEIKPADINEILEKSSSMFGRTKKEIAIHRKYAKDLFTVEVARGQIEQVFINLYVNAWQAMPGGGTLYLETENVLLDNDQIFSYDVKPGNYVKISITDNGAGMDEETKKRIFDPFFTTKEIGRGTGLGLATVYGIIKGHKGFIDVYSEPGHGTTFTIYLPASEKEVVKEKTQAGTIARGTEKILLVDDEKTVLDVCREILRHLGYQVYTAGSGQEAIDVYTKKKREIDLVILDMVMPGLSGRETFDHLRKLNPLAKIILSSGYSINKEAQEVMDKGCSGFIQKPFQLQKLSSKKRWSSLLRQPPTVFKWFAAFIYTASLIFVNVLQYTSSGVLSARPW